MQKIGSYEIIQPLGEGGMGVVYLGRDPDIGRYVAVKTIRLLDAGDTEQREMLRKRLFQEARAAGVLNHPGIVTIYQVGEQEKVAYIAMEYVAGSTLERLMQQQTLNSETVHDILTQTATALDYAHQRSIIHRDIKPANIMLTEDGRVKVCDFGIAKVFGGQTSLTSAGGSLGTPLYCSPEQLKGEKVDPRADQYSLAVVAYQMLTGRRPFEGTSIESLLFKIIMEPPPPAHEVRPSIPVAVSRVLQRGLSKFPQERYDNCTELVKRLVRAQTDPSAADGGNTPQERTKVTPLPGAGPARAAVPPPPPPPPMPPLSTPLPIPTPTPGGNRPAPARPAAPSRGMPIWAAGLLGVGAATIAILVVMQLRQSPAPPGPGPTPTPAPAVIPGPTVVPGPTPTLTTPTARPLGPTPTPTALPSIPPPAVSVTPPVRAVVKHPLWSMPFGSPEHLADFTGPRAARIEWEIQREGSIRGAPVIGGDGTVYVGDSSRALGAIGPDGKERWTYAAGAPIQGGPGLLSDGTIVFGTTDGTFYAVTTDGTLAWKQSLSGAIVTSPTIDAQDRIYIGTQGSHVYILDRTGRSIAQHKVSGAVAHPIVLTGRGAYLVTAGQELLLLRETVVASFGIGDDASGSPVSDANGNFYVAGGSGDVFGLDGRLGKLWQYRSQAHVLTSLAWRNGILLFGAARQLYALKDGELSWKYPTGGVIRSAPVTDRAGVTYFGSQDGWLYAVDANGRLAWKVDVHGEVAGGPAFTRDGGIYVATINRRVVKLRE